MSFNYSGLANTATRLINEFGAPSTFHKVTSGSFDPLTGVNTDTTEDITLNAVRLEFSSSDIDGTLIQQGDFVLLIDGVQDVNNIDAVTVDGVKYQIVRPMPLKTGDTRLITKAQCRK